MPQTNPKTTNVAVPAAGAPTWALIACTLPNGKTEVIEDPNFNAGQQQGLQGYYLDPNATLSPAFLANPTPQAAQLAGYLANPNLQVFLPNGGGGTGRAYQPVIFGGDAGRVHGGFGGTVGAQGTGLLLLQMYAGLAGGVLLTEWP